MDKDGFLEILKKLGLTDREARIYLTVLEMGEMPISRIALKGGLKRSTAYLSIESLKNRGLLSENRKNGIRYISVLSPEVLIDYFKKTTQFEINERLEAIKRAEERSSELQSLKYASPLKPRIRFFEGRAGVEQVLRECTHSKVHSIGFADYEHMPPDFLEFIKNEITPRRRKSAVYQWLIPDSPANRELQKNIERRGAQHKTLHFTSLKGPIELFLFGTSEIAFLSFSKGEIFAVLIDSSALHLALKNIFLHLWKTSS